MYSPTESTEPTELLAECIPPQISQIYTEVRLRKIVAEVSGLRSTSLPTFVLFVLFVVVHTTQYHVVRTRITRITRIRLIRLLNIFSHRLHRFTQKLGCLQGGALETGAPPEISRFCEFCVFCGRHFATAEAGDLRYYLPHPNTLCRSAFYVKIQMF